MRRIALPSYRHRHVVLFARISSTRNEFEKRARKQVNYTILINRGRHRVILCFEGALQGKPTSFIANLTENVLFGWIRDA